MKALHVVYSLTGTALLLGVSALIRAVRNKPSVMFAIVKAVLDHFRQVKMIDLAEKTADPAKALADMATFEHAAQGHPKPPAASPNTPTDTRTAVVPLARAPDTG